MSEIECPYCKKDIEVLFMPLKKEKKIVRRPSLDGHGYQRQDKDGNNMYFDSLE